MARSLWPNGKTYPGAVWHEYGPRKPIWTPNGWTSNFHGGIDIGPWDGTYSTWLLSPVDGVVVHAGYDNIFGNRVVIRGNGADFWLCHGKPDSMRVRVGQNISRGAQVMLMGETGKASGVHVHYEVHVNGKRVDPRDYYRSGAAAGSSTPPPVTQSEEDEEMPLSFINVQGKSGSHHAGLFAVLRSNSGTLFAKRVTKGSTDPNYPTIPAEALGDWQKTMKFYELTD